MEAVTKTPDLVKENEKLEETLKKQEALAFRFKAENDQLKEENRSLMKENERLKNTVAKWERVSTRAIEQVEKCWEDMRDGRI